MSQQVVYGNIRHIRFVGRLAIICTEYSCGAKDLVSQVEFAVLNQRKNRNRSDWLGKIDDAKKRVLLGLSRVLTVCHAACVIIDKASTP